MSALLEVRHLRKRFGGIAAVDDCSFEVDQGTVTALIGPNGSGKTTVFNLITGYVAADAGDVVFNGRRYPRPTPGRLCHDGLVRTFQQARVFPALTVLDNLVAAAAHPWWALASPRVSRADRATAGELIVEFGLGKVADLPASQLSYGQRKLLEFAAVLMSEPKLVLLDEPTAGVNPNLVATMERHIRERHAKGITFLVVEHDMNVVMRLCDPVIVLDHGATIARGAPAAVQANPAVLDAYLGE
jgi:ABC-type branched-subunit amino acid transport system ATPase component